MDFLKTAILGVIGVVIFVMVALPILLFIVLTRKWTWKEFCKWYLAYLDMFVFERK
jgi:hypothetical protein